MRPDRTHILVAFFAIMLMPFAVWAALGIAREVYKANLRPWLRMIRVLRWITWCIGGVAGLTALVSDMHWFLPIAMSIANSSGGLSFPERWLKRHYAPELLQSHSQDGWWPIPRD